MQLTSGGIIFDQECGQTMDDRTTCVAVVRPHLKKLVIVLFSRKRWVGGNIFKNNFYRRIGTKNESMEQLNALKSCPFSPGVI